MLSLFLSIFLTFVELNCENLFDCRHDSLKNDTEFMPHGERHWTRTRYWTKLNHIGQEILSSADELPDIVALCEVENDTVMHDLTRRSLLRNAGYEYIITESPDTRGIDVALLYQPLRFLPLCYDYITVKPIKGMRPTRDILYIKGITQKLDTLHLFVVHAPSRYGGEKASRPFRMHVAQTLAKAIEPIKDGNIIITGDFNDYSDSKSLLYLESCGLTNITRHAKGKNGKAKATYRHKGEWNSLDHFLVSSSLLPKVKDVYINDDDYLLEEETMYGGYRPRRSFSGYRFHRDGFSDHLPLVLTLL